MESRESTEVQSAIAELLKSIESQLQILQKEGKNSFHDVYLQVDTCVDSIKKLLGSSSVSKYRGTIQEWHKAAEDYREGRSIDEKRLDTLRMNMMKLVTDLRCELQGF